MCALTGHHQVPALRLTDPLQSHPSCSLCAMIGCRGGTSQLEECDMNATWDNASDILLDWQHANVEWEGADFPLLLSEDMTM